MIPNVTNSSERLAYPFSAVIGHPYAKHALLLLAVDPGLRGALIASETGSAKSTLARGFAQLLVRDGYQSDDEGGTRLDAVHLPLNVTEDMLLGGLDVEQMIATGNRRVEAGLLCRANGQILLIDEVNLLEPETAVHIAAALDSRKVLVERHGITASHDADFTLVGTYDPEAGEPNALLRERVGLLVNQSTEFTTEETSEIIDRVLRFDDDAASFHEDFALETADISSAIIEARARLRLVRISKEQRWRIASVAMTLGVEGNRADLFALKAARANAALAGRESVTEEDLVVAIRLVLAPRATSLPIENAQSEEQNETTEPEADETGSSNDGELECEPGKNVLPDIVAQPLDASIPEELFATVKNSSSRTRAGKRTKSTKAIRGRYVRSSQARSGGDLRIAIAATLRAAAPFQLRRRLQSESSIAAANNDGPDATNSNRQGRRVRIERDDIRFKEFKLRSGILFILAVDSSGSMAFNRMSQAKGALTRLLQQAYLHRDKVALISFRGQSAEVLLAPTRSVDLARRIVDALPAGGGTPLSAGLVKAIEVSRLARLTGMTQAMLVLFTDGRANVALTQAGESGNSSTVNDELKTLGRLLSAEDISAVVVDTKSRFVSRGDGNSLADMLGAKYLYLPRPEAGAVYDAIASITRRPRES